VISLAARWRVSHSRQSGETCPLGLRLFSDRRVGGVAPLVDPGQRLDAARLASDVALIGAAEIVMDPLFADPVGVLATAAHAPLSAQA